MPPPDPASSSHTLRRLFGRGSAYTVGLAVQMSAALLVVPIVTRLLSVKSYGEIGAALVVYMILSILATAGLSQAISRVFFQGPDGPRKAHQFVVATVAAAILIAIVADLTGPLWAPLVSLKYSAVLRIAVWGGAAAAVLLSVQSVLRCADRVKAFLVAGAIASLGAQLLGLGLVALSGSPAGYMGGLAIGTVAGAVAGLAATGSLRHGWPSVHELRGGLALGAPLIPHGLAIYLLASADRIAIAAILGFVEVGRYQVAYAIGSLGVALITALNQAWIPLLMGTPARQRWVTLRDTSRVVHRFSALVAGGLAVAVPLALSLAAPASYERAALVPVSAVVAFSVLPYATSCAYFHVLFITGNTRIMAVAAPLAAGVNVLMNVLLLPAMGLLAASVATVAAYAVLAGVGAWKAQRLVALPGVGKDALRAWALAAPLVAAGALLPPTLAGNSLRVALATLILAAAARLAWSLKENGRDEMHHVSVRPVPGG